MLENTCACKDGRGYCCFSGSEVECFLHYWKTGDVWKDLCNEALVWIVNSERFGCHCSFWPIHMKVYLPLLRKVCADHWATFLAVYCTTNVRGSFWYLNQSACLILGSASWIVEIWELITCGSANREVVWRCYEATETSNGGSRRIGVVGHLTSTLLLSITVIFP